MLDTHRVSLKSLDTLAAGVADPAVVRWLGQADRSRRLTLLRAVLDRARGRATGPLPSLDEAWTLLAAAQKRDPAAAEQVLGHPRTGLWAAKVLRSLGDAGDTPLWAELGGLHQTATAAAIRAGIEFRTRVPVWRGSVLLPTLGLATVGGRHDWDYAQVHGEGGRVLVRGTAGSVRLPEDRTADGAGWLALRHLSTPGWEPWLDDLDPEREFGEPVPPHRLSLSDVDRWTAELRSTRELLSTHHPEIAAEFAAGLTTLVPHPPIDRHTPYSASHVDAFGSMALSRPDDPATFAAMLVHEFQHSKFGVLLTLVHLLDPDADDEPGLYAPWRNDPRPPSAVLHGVYSFLGVAAFYRAHRNADPGPGTAFEFAYRREQAVHAAGILLTEAAPSALGRRFLTIAAGRLTAWGADPVPADVRAAAARANADHHLQWRLRHLAPPESTVAELAKSWLRNRPKPLVHRESTRIRPEPSGSPACHARLALTRLSLTDPELHGIYRSAPELAMSAFRGATEADLALVDGDFDVAADAYRAEITADRASTSAWAGLALASGRAALRDQPELVAAVYEEVLARTGNPPDPLHLANWLG